MEMIKVLDLADELGIHRTNIYKLLDRLNIVKTIGFDPISKQQVGFITIQDAEKIREYRTPINNIDFDNIIKKSEGIFYVVSLVPDILKNRIKFGFTTNLESRINAHRTTCPTLDILKTYPCENENVEETFIKMCTTKEDSKLSDEIYDLKDVEKTIKRLDQIYYLLNE